MKILHLKKHSAEALPVPACPGRSFALCLLMMACLCANIYAADHALSLTRAEQLALSSAPNVDRYIARSQAMDNQAEADDRLPDPKLKLGAVNFPVDTFDYDQEPMTQLVVGIQQQFPRGDSLQYKREQSKLLSRSALASAEDARLKLLRDVRENYLNLYYQDQAYRVIRETRTLFSRLLKITESNYALGKSSQQDVMQATLEMSRLDDRAEKILTEQERYQTRLARWVGDEAFSPISQTFPELPGMPDTMDLNDILTRHPMIRAQEANIMASKKQSDIAEQEYAPGWSLAVDYGFRDGTNMDGSDRADFATAMVALDIPLFSGDEKKRNVEASHKKTSEAQYVKDDELRDLKQLLEQNRRVWKRLNERAHLYEKNLLKAAKDNSDAALNAYQSGVSEFNTLMRAQITELDVKLEHLRLLVDREVAKAEILYVTGGDTHETE